MSTPDLAVIGGSGFYTFLDDPETVEVETPYGPPSAPIAVGDRRRTAAVAFLPRHGPEHQLPGAPGHRIAPTCGRCAALGVRQILAPCAVGGLQAELGPGTFVVPDQLVDRTTARVQTFYDSGASHVSFADPYCPRLRAHLLARPATDSDPSTAAPWSSSTARGSPPAPSRSGTPAQGWSLVNMTGHPEAVLARELALCYATVALVTDHDAGRGRGRRRSTRTRCSGSSPSTPNAASAAAAADVVASVGTDRDCACAHALDGMDLPFELPA